MQSNVTLTKIKRAFKSTALAFGFLSLFTGLAKAQTYVNGPLSTGATSSNGVAAPTGFTWSEVQLGNTNAGFGANITAGLTVADNFVVPAGPSWAVSTAKFYAYSTGFAGSTSPFVDVRVQIFSTDPSVGSPTPVFGNLTTNRFASSTSAGMYRIFNATTGTTRRIWEITANIGTTLAPGTYWIEWQLGNGGISNFSPSVTVVGQVTQPGNNGKQHDLNSNTWTNLLDGANAQDMPFKLDYTTGACAGTPAPGNTIASAAAVCPATPFSLSLQNSTAGSGVTYQWFSGPSATGPWTAISGATNSTYAATSLAATSYFYATVTCSGNTGSSTPVQVALNPPSACYCIPSPASDCTDDDVIERVTVGGMNKTSTCAASGYSNYTSTDTASLIVGGSNPITVVTGDSWSEQVGVWIDYDRSGSFEASEFTNLGLTTAGSGGIHNGAIAVPSTVATGYTRMRVRVRFSTALTGTQACLGYAFGETEDYTVNLVPCVPVTITSQPVNRTIACAANTTFTVGLAGSLPVAYWEYRTSASGVWQNVVNGGVYSGANTTTLTLTTVPQAMSGYQFRAVYAGACNGVDFSNAATLTITPLVATVSNSLPITRCISDAPTQITVTNLSGATATASTASGTLHTLIPDNNDETIGQNTNAINHSINVTNVPGGVTINGFSVRVNLTHAWVGDMIMVLRAPNGKTISLDYALSATGGAGPTTGFTNTIISSKGTALLSSGANPYTGTFRLDNVGASTPGFTPTGPAGYDPNTTVLSEMFQGNGTWTLAMYDYYGDFTTANFLENWEINIDYGAPATGVFTPATGLFTDAAGTVPYTGTAINTVYANPAATTTYSLVVTTPNCVSAALSIPVRVGSPISGSSSVNNAAVCTGGNAAFKATAPTGGANRTYQWQESTDAGASWNNVANGTHYTGATTDSLTILDATNTMNNNRYRVVMTVAECSSILNSAAGTLTVNPLPVLTVSANPYTAIYPGQTTTLAVASSTTVPANGYQWYRNGVAVAGATGNTLVVDVDGLGEYTVTANDANSCGNANTPSISITEAPNSILFIYPSPNSGQFQVRYYSQAGNSPLPRLLNIYDSKGSRVYSKQYNIAAPYARMDVDLSNLSAGIYHVELLDRTGNRIKTGRVLIQK